MSKDPNEAVPVTRGHLDALINEMVKSVLSDNVARHATSLPDDVERIVFALAAQRTDALDDDALGEPYPLDEDSVKTLKFWDAADFRHALHAMEAKSRDAYLAAVRFTGVADAAIQSMEARGVKRFGDKAPPD